MPEEPASKRNFTSITRETRSSGPVGAVDAGALSLALAETARPRESTPTASPSRKRQRIYGDRFVPNRQGQDIQASFSLLGEDGSPSTPSRSKRRPANSELHFQRSMSIRSVQFPVLANIIQLMRPTGSIPRCSEVNFLTLRSPNPPLHSIPQISSKMATGLRTASSMVQEPLRLRPTYLRTHSCPHNQIPQPLTRTCSNTCHHTVTWPFLGILPRHEHQAVAVAST